MPNIKSAIKRMNSDKRKAAYSKSKKSELKTSLKKAEQAIEASADNAAELAQETQRKLDQAVAKGLIHKHKASRKKSQLAKKLNNA